MLILVIAKATKYLLLRITMLLLKKMFLPQRLWMQIGHCQCSSPKGVTVMLAGGIGDGAVQVLSSNGIQVVRNCKGDANAVLVEYLQGNIVDGGVNCSHDHNHQCSH